MMRLAVRLLRVAQLELVQLRDLIDDIRGGSVSFGPIVVSTRKHRHWAVRNAFELGRDYERGRATKPVSGEPAETVGGEG